MNTKEIVAIGIALIMTGVMLTGCGNGVDHKDYMKDSGSVTASVDKDVEKDSDKKSETADKADEDKKDKAQSETEKKADATENAGKDSKAEDSKKSDTGSSVSNSGNAGNSSNSGSVSKPNTGSGNSNTGNNGNHNGSVNKPSGGNNSNSGNSGNNGNHNGGNKPSEPEKPAPHVCNFNIWKDEVSHTEMVTETYTEQVPKYKWVGYHECRKCGFQTEDDDAIALHIFDCDSTYTTLEKQVQDGFETVTKTRQVPKTVVDDPAHYECSCGKRK